MEKEFDLGMTEEEINRSAEDLAAEIDDFDLVEEECKYEIVLIGNDKNDLATDFAVVLDDGYTEETEAKLCYDYCSNAENLQEKLASDNVMIPEEVKHLYLRLNMMVANGEICADILEECEVKIN